MSHAYLDSTKKSSQDSSQKDSVALLLKYLHKELSIERLDEKDAIHSAGQPVLALLAVRPGAVKELAYKKLNVYPFKDVPLCWRRAFEEACLWQVLKGLEAIVEAAKNDATCNETNPTGLHRSGYFAHWVDETIKLCDQAIIFTGAPSRRSVIDVILEWIELETPSVFIERRYEPLKSESFELDQDQKDCRSRKRRRLSSEVDNNDSVPTSCSSLGEHFVPALSKKSEIKRHKRPSLAQFEQHVQNIQTPLILSDTLDLWPAVKRWKDPRYWLQQTLSGRRLVPVELGKSYTDDGWGQRIISFRDFLQNHLIQDGLSTAGYGGSPGKIKDRSPHTIGYLAQHDLFAQIPALRKDFVVPDYCYVETPESLKSEDESPDEETKSPKEPQLNIWLGPANTVSPAHTDPHHNILAQVFGRKYVRLFAPSETPKMYPMTEITTSSDTQDTQAGNTINTHGVDMGNTSSVDVGSFVSWYECSDANSLALRSGNGHNEDLPALFLEDAKKFPLHQSAEYVEAILEAGDCLYIPKGWWHYIRSIETSCNVSFWWD